MAPMAPMSNLARFYLARYQGALEDIRHDNIAAAADTCCDLLLQPTEISPFLRALVNTTFATTASVRRHPDKMIFIDRAKTIHADLRTWPKEHNSDIGLDFLEKTINDAEAFVKEELATAKAQVQASQDKKDGSENVEMKS